MNQLTRRTFIQSGAAVGATATLPMRSLLAASAADQVNLGVVGCGWRGGQLLKYFQALEGVAIAGLCDVDRSLLDEQGQQAPQAKRWTDLRQMFDSPDIDAVVVATCNHWHCLAAIWAMQAGKHVYVEKPLGHSQWEGEQVVKAAQVYGKICQVGTQQRSDPMQEEIKQFLHNDKAIGEIESVRVNRFGVREPIGRRAEPLSPPAGVNYDLWLGPAQEQPIYRDKLHYDWHWDWNTGSGEMGNWGVHIIDDVRNNVFLDKVAAPSAITAAGSRFAWNDAGNTPNVHFAVLDAGGLPVVVTLSNLPWKETSAKIPGPGSGYIVYGSGGQLQGRRGGAKALDPNGKLIRKFEGDDQGGNVYHQQNFIDAIRAHQPSLLAAPVQVGHDSTSWCNMINIATRAPITSEPAAIESLPATFGEQSTASILQQLNTIVAANSTASSAPQLQLGPTLRFSTESAQFMSAGSKFANDLLRREDREPYVVPEVS
ncbi:MAG: Gfo/Idh/MocA family protein [Bythopirellula sp.]